MGKTRLIVAVVVCIGLAGRAMGMVNASYVITDLTNFLSLTGSPNQSHSGQGFVCMSSEPGPAMYWHLFAFGGTAEFRTAMQVDISDLIGHDVTSATLRFVLKDEGLTRPQDVTFTSFSASGTLGFTYTPADNLGAVTASIAGPQPLQGVSVSAAVDVTPLLRDRVASGAEWFGLYVTGADSSTDGTYGTWTFVPAPGGTITTLLPDAAQVRLDVTYSPEPAGLTAASAVTAALIARRRRT